MAALASVGTPLSGLGAAPTQLLLQALPCAPRLLTPAWLRGHLQGAAARNPQTSAALVAAAAAAVGTTQSLGLDVSATGACALLLYCIADLDDTDPDMVAQLAGLPLVPMQSGGLGTLQADGGGGKESGGGRNDDNGGGGAGGRMFLAAREDEVLLAAVPQLVLDQAAAGPELTARWGLLRGECQHCSCSGLASAAAPLAAHVPVSMAALRVCLHSAKTLEHAVF